MTDIEEAVFPFGELDNGALSLVLDHLGLRLGFVYSPSLAYLIDALSATSPSVTAALAVCLRGVGGETLSHLSPLKRGLFGGPHRISGPLRRIMYVALHHRPDLAPHFGGLRVRVDAAPLIAEARFDLKTLVSLKPSLASLLASTIPARNLSRLEVTAGTGVDAATVLLGGKPLMSKSLSLALGSLAGIDKAGGQPYVHGLKDLHISARDPIEGAYPALLSLITVHSELERLSLDLALTRPEVAPSSAELRGDSLLPTLAAALPHLSYLRISDALPLSGAARLTQLTALDLLLPHPRSAMSAMSDNDAPGAAPGQTNATSCGAAAAAKGLDLSTLVCLETLTLRFPEYVLLRAAAPVNRADAHAALKPRLAIAALPPALRSLSLENLVGWFSRDLSALLQGPSAARLDSLHLLWERGLQWRRPGGMALTLQGTESENLFEALMPGAPLDLRGCASLRALSLQGFCADEKVLLPPTLTALSALEPVSYTDPAAARGLVGHSGAVGSASGSGMDVMPGGLLVASLASLPLPHLRRLHISWEKCFVESSGFATFYALVRTLGARLRHLAYYGPILLSERKLWASTVEELPRLARLDLPEPEMFVSSLIAKKGRTFKSAREYAQWAAGLASLVASGGATPATPPAGHTPVADSADPETSAAAGSPRLGAGEARAEAQVDRGPAAEESEGGPRVVGSGVPEARPRARRLEVSTRLVSEARLLMILQV